MEGAGGGGTLEESQWSYKPRMVAVDMDIKGGPTFVKSINLQTIHKLGRTVLVQALNRA